MPVHVQEQPWTAVTVLVSAHSEKVTRQPRHCSSSGFYLEQNILWQAQLCAFHDAFPGPHPVYIPSQGVDLTVVTNHAHGL